MRKGSVYEYDFHDLVNELQDVEWVTSDDDVIITVDPEAKTVTITICKSRTGYDG